MACLQEALQIGRQFRGVPVVRFGGTTPAPGDVSFQRQPGLKFTQTQRQGQLVRLISQLVGQMLQGGGFTGAGITQQDQAGILINPLPQAVELDPFYLRPKLDPFVIFSLSPLAASPGRTRRAQLAWTGHKLGRLTRQFDIIGRVFSIARFESLPIALLISPQLQLGWGTGLAGQEAGPLSR